MRKILLIKLGFWKSFSCISILYINSRSASVRPSDATVSRFNSPAEPARTVGRTDSSMGEPARTDGLCIISTNARWSVCLWAASLFVTVGIKVDIHVCERSVCLWRWVSRLIFMSMNGQSVCDGGYQGWYSWLSYIFVVLKRVLKKNQISTSNCLEPGSSLKFFHPPKLHGLTKGHYLS
jgi:hypothetical protein